MNIAKIEKLQLESDKNILYYQVPLVESICLIAHYRYEYQTKTMMTHQIGWQLSTKALPLYVNAINLSCMEVPTG